MSLLRISSITGVILKKIVYDVRNVEVDEQELKVEAGVICSFSKILRIFVKGLVAALG